jgi:hypothetical protein
METKKLYGLASYDKRDPPATTLLQEEQQLQIPHFKSFYQGSSASVLIKIRTIKSNTYFAESEASLYLQHKSLPLRTDTSGSF